MPAALTVSEVAASAGVSASAVRFYDKHGLITAVRTSGNQRRFDVHAACRIRIARVAQRIGLTVTEIAELLAGQPPDAGLEDFRRQPEQQAAEALRRITELNAVLDDVTSGAKLCEL